MNVSYNPSMRNNLDALAALRFGWARFRHHALLLMGVSLASLGIPHVLGLLFPHGLLFQGIEMLIGYTIGLMLISLQLSVAHGRAMDWREVANRITLRNFVNSLGVALCVWVIVGAGLVLLVVPGVIWALMFSQAGLLVLDRDMTPMVALKESARLTRGFKGGLFGFWILTALLTLISLMPMVFAVRAGHLWILGLAPYYLLMLPIEGLAVIHIYRFLQDRHP